MWRTSALVGGLIAAGVAGDPASACSCIPETVAEYICGHEVIFEGLALKSVTAGNDQAITTFKVEKNWRGASQQEVTVSHGLDGGMCGVRFNRGASQTVFASRKAD